jgi:hypothetical protein
MTITDRDKRFLIALGVFVPLILIYRFASSSDPSTVASWRPADVIPIEERRLVKLRQISAAEPGKEQILSQVNAELAAREKGLIKSDSAPQAQAQVVQLLRQVGRNQSPPLEFRSVEIGQVRPFGDSYGEVLVTVAFDAQIEQLVQFMADLTAQKELIATNEIRIGQAHPKQKSMPVRLTASGIVSKSLLPAKKAPGRL